MLHPDDNPQPGDHDDDRHRDHNDNLPADHNTLPLRVRRGVSVPVQRVRLDADLDQLQRIHVLLPVHAVLHLRRHVSGLRDSVPNATNDDEQHDDEQHDQHDDHDLPGQLHLGDEVRWRHHGLVPGQLQLHERVLRHVLLADVHGTARDFGHDLL